MKALTKQELQTLCIHAWSEMGFHEEQIAKAFNVHRGDISVAYDEGVKITERLLEGNELASN